MIFTAYGHPNITAKHNTTIEFTKDKEVSLDGDCIVGVNADFSLSELEKIKNKKIKIIIKADELEEEINAEINPDFNDDREMVIRKTDFVSKRTFAINADKAAVDLRRELVELLKDKKNKIKIIIQKLL